MIIRYWLRLYHLLKVHYWHSYHTLKEQNKNTVVGNAFFIDWRTVPPNQWIYLWGSCILCSNCRCLPFFILPDECLFQKKKRDNEGYMIENDKIRAKPRRTLKDLKTFRSTSTSSWYASYNHITVSWISSDYFESLLLPQLLRGENDSKQSDEIQATHYPPIVKYTPPPPSQKGRSRGWKRRRKSRNHVSREKKCMNHESLGKKRQES